MFKKKEERKTRWGWNSAVFLTNTRVFDKEEEPPCCIKALVQKLADGPATQAPNKPMSQEAHGCQTLQISRKSSFFTKGMAETKSRQTPDYKIKSGRKTCTKQLRTPFTLSRTKAPQTRALPRSKETRTRRNKKLERHRPQSKCLYKNTKNMTVLAS